MKDTAYIIIKVLVPICYIGWWIWRYVALAEAASAEACAALGTFGVSDSVGLYAVAVPADQFDAAFMTERGFTSVDEDISAIDIAQAGIETDLSRLLHGLHWCGRQIQGLVVRMESADVPGHGRSQFAGNEIGQRCQFLRRIIGRRDNQGCHFQPDVGVMGDVF